MENGKNPVIKPILPSINGKLLPFYSTIDRNSDGEFLMSCNNYYNRIWNSNVFGFNSFEDIEKRKDNNRVYTCTHKSSITALTFLTDLKFIVTTQASEVEVWSTKVDDNYDYCLFKLSTAYNQGYATDLAVMRNSKTALTVSSKGHICHYDYGAEDITALRTMHHAHSDCINGVSFNPDSNENVFATSSDDKSILIWDLRIKTKRMASGLYEYNGASFHGIHWSTLTENKGLVLAGDIAGNLFSFDVRKPFVVYSKISASDRCIRKIIFNGKPQFGIVANTNAVRIFVAEADGTYALSYSYINDCNTIRDFIWDQNENDSFFIVGDNYFAKNVVFS